MRFPRLIRVARLSTLLAAGGLAFSACGGSSSTPALTAPADAGLAVFAVPTIRWDSPSYTATAGDVKVFVGNNDNVKHVLVILQGDKTVGDLKLTINKKGEIGRAHV